MSGMKSSPFGKRLRTNKDTDDEAPQRNRPRINPIFGVSNISTPSLDSTHSASDSSAPLSPEPRRAAPKDYSDRFVPARDIGSMRTSYNLMEEGGSNSPSKANRIIPSESDAVREQSNALFTSLLYSEIEPADARPSSPVRIATGQITAPSTPSRKRLFTYNSPSASNPNTPTRRVDTPNDDVYSLSPVRAESRHLLESPRRQLRSVCKTPYRVLDAPDLADDFYLNLVDWSSTNVLGVGLGSCVYLWTAHTAAVSKLCDLSQAQDTVSSVSWVQKGTTLAVGTLAGRLHIYDANTIKPIRSYSQAHTQRIGALAWNEHVLSSGSRDRMIHHRDVRDPSIQPFLKSTGHRQEVCGLRWSDDYGGMGGSGAGSSRSVGVAGAMLASGGNDNKVCIWDLRGSRRPTTGRGAPSTSAAADEGNSANDQPLWKFHEHTAAVKALAWDPHVPGVLATGGGTQDKTIRFWNVFNGTMLNELDTGSQVCNLIWSLTSHELVSTHGYSSTTAQNQICIWKYPTLNMVAALTGHTHRVLYLAMSPDGETIVTGAGDETLRFWNAFPKKEDRDTKKDSKLDFGKLIR